MNPDYEFLIAIHELLEWYLTQKKGIRIEEIDRFDILFERGREKDNTDEPGDDINAPYYDEHQFASRIERIAAEELGVDWTEYDNYCRSI